MPTNIAIRLQSTGGADLKRDLEEAGRSGEQAFKGISTAADAAGAATDRLTRKAQEAADAARRVPTAGGAAGPTVPYPTTSPTAQKEFERLRTQLDEEYRKAKQLGSAEDRIDRGVSGGYYSAAEAERLRTLAAGRYGSGNDNDPSRRGLSTYDKQFVRYQGFDVASTLGSGGSLTTAAFQQGPQLLQQLADREGGLRAGLSQLGESAKSLVTPFTLAGAAAVAATATFAIAASQYSKDQATLTRGLQGTGRATELSIAQLDAYATRNAEAGKVSTSTAREIAASFAQTGDIAVPVFDTLISRTAEYARLTGQEVPAATAELARMFADPAKGADDLGSKLGGLDDRTRQYVATLAEQGDKTAAQTALAEALKAQIDANAAATTRWGNAWNFVSSTADKAWESIKRAAGASVTTPQTVLADLDVRLRNVTQNAPDSALAKQIRAERDAAKAEVDRAEEAERRRAKTEQAIKASVEAGNLSRNFDPILRQRADNQKNLNTLNASLDDPESRSRLADVDAAVRARDAYKRAVESSVDANGKLIDSQELLRRQDQLALDATKAKTAAEKADIAERRRTLELIGKPVSEADARRQITRQGILARAEADASKDGGSKGKADAKDDYDRATRAIEDRIRRQGEEATTFGQGAEAVARYRTEQELLTAAKRADRDITSDLSAQIKDYADRAAEAARRNEELRDAMRTTDSVRAAGGDGIRSIVSDLQKGTNATNLLTSATSRLATAFSNMASDQIAEGFFGKRGSSGWLSDLLKPATTGSTDTGGIAGFLASAKSFFGFADGGYTGAGMRLEPAGIVHRGEYVIDRASVDRIGIGTLDAMRKGARGYADGGYVRPTPASRAAFGSPASADAMPSVVINNNGAPVQVQSAQMVTDGQGNRRLEMTLGDMVATGAKTPQGRQAVGRQKLVST
jgi:phage-related minor tail protein